MNDEIVAAAKPEADRLLHAYEAAVIEFNLATVPLILALTAHTLPMAAEVLREESARAAVIEARRKVWATYGQD
jgi:phosphoribosylformylglycinamidine (FGAM) synthase-like enzyme